MNEIKLFCLPYAGGSAMVYKKWEKYLNKSIKLCLLELAGRGSRSKEPYYKSMQEAVDNLYSMMEASLDGGEYAIFGHSMGSILSYKLAEKISESKLKGPVHIFFSGRYPPCILKEERKRHLLPEQEFIQEAIMMGGISEKLLRYEVLLKKAMETLRADYRIIETEGYYPDIKCLDSDISVMFGSEDELADLSEMTIWKKYTNKQCNFHLFEGGHFYLHESAKSLVKIINDTLIGY
jgi:surfactin synthase thioesterase subunit